jgi:hypothetical protein
VILDTTLKLEVTMAGSASTSQPECHIDFIDYTPDGKTAPPATIRTALSHATDVTVLAAPVNAQAREIIHIGVYNKDTASQTITVKTDNGTTEFIEVKQVVPTLRTLAWEKESGWYLI